MEAIAEEHVLRNGKKIVLFFLSLNFFKFAEYLGQKMSGSMPRLYGGNECILLQFINGRLFNVGWIISFKEYLEFLNSAWIFQNLHRLSIEEH